MAGYQYNSDGLVAIKHYNSNPCTVQLLNGHIYSFSPRQCVSMAWIEEKDVQKIMEIKANMCCGIEVQKFMLANALDVCLWTTGERC